VLDEGVAAYVEEAERVERELGEVTSERDELRRELIHSEKINVLGQMAGGVAHEFNNLLAIMSGYAELALEDLSDTKRVREAWRVVQESCARAASVTSALLSFARKQAPKKEYVDINTLIERQLGLLASELLDHEVEVQKDFAPGVATLVDPGQLEQVFMNLFTNALHAMRGGGTLSVSTMGINEQVIVEVSDTGEGIAPKNLARVFTPFYTTKGAYGGGDIGGSGLGLSVSQGIIESHGGTISVQSETGRGTTFAVTLPLKKSVDEGLSGIEEADEPAVRAGASKRSLQVLVVDDEAHMRQLLCAQLTHMGHDVLEASSGEQAIQLCRVHTPDLILLDILMPGMNGADALIEIRRLHPDVGVAAVTGQAGPSLEAMLEAMRRTGNISLIRKPFRLREIAAFVQGFLAEHQASS